MIKRRNSNPDENFEKACAENNIVLTDNKENLQSVHTINFNGVVSCCSQIQIGNGAVLKKIKEIREELRKLRELRKLIIELEKLEEKYDVMLKDEEKVYVEEGIVKNYIMLISDLVQEIKKQYE